MCILGPFANQANSNVFPLRTFPILCASCGLSQNKQIQTCFLFEASHVACILRPFTKQSSSNAFLCVHLGAFRRASKLRLQMSFLFEVSCLVCILRPFAERANSNALPFRGSPFCLHHGAFRRASKFKRLSSSGLSILSASWGLLQSKQEFKRLSSSRFPTLCASWGVSPSRENQTSFLGLPQSKQLQTSFLFEVSYFACILGPFAEHAHANVFPLRCFLYCLHLWAFRRGKQIQKPFLFKDTFFVCILGPLSKQVQFFFWRIPILCASWSVSQSKPVHTAFLFEVSYLVRFSQSKQIQTSFLFEASHFVCIWGAFRNS